MTMAPLRSHLCLLVSLAISCPSLPVHSFIPPPLPRSRHCPSVTAIRHIHENPHCRTRSRLALSNQDDERIRIEEESRVKILSDRRKTIRGILKAADGTRNFRLKNGRSILPLPLLLPVFLSLLLSLSRLLVESHFVDMAQREFSSLSMKKTILSSSTITPNMLAILSSFPQGTSPESTPKQTNP